MPSVSTVPGPRLVRVLMQTIITDMNNTLVEIINSEFNEIQRCEHYLHKPMYLYYTNLHLMQFELEA